ncbi:MAG: hypothetical protein WAX66_02660 [Patescibacteria group bacterium]
MKKIIRTALFVFLSLYSIQFFVKPFEYGGDYIKTMFLVVLALTLLYLFLKPLVSIVSLPAKGITYIFIVFITTTIVFYVLTTILNGFSVHASTLPGLTIFGYVLPSKGLDGIWTMVFSGLMTSILYLFLESLCSKK